MRNALSVASGSRYSQKPNAKLKKKHVQKEKEFFHIQRHLEAFLLLLELASNSTQCHNAKAPNNKKEKKKKNEREFTIKNCLTTLSATLSEIFPTKTVVTGAFIKGSCYNTKKKRLTSRQLQIHVFLTTAM